MQLPPDTARLRFRPFRESDAEPFLEVLRDPYALMFYPDMSLDIANRWVQRNLQRYEDDGFGLWIVELIDTGQMIGDCGLTMQQVDGYLEFEIGYHIHSAHRRRGYAREAAASCLAYGFRQTGAPRIISLVHKKNIASQKVAQSIHVDREETVRRGMPHWVYFTRRDHFTRRDQHQPEDS